MPPTVTDLNPEEITTRFENLPRNIPNMKSFQKRMVIEYKANLKCIEVKYLARRETLNTSKTCYRCGDVAQVKGREFKCPRCRLIYNRDLNACVNIAHALMRGIGWGES